MTAQGLLFFADRLPPLVGGMEMHACYFIEYFTNHLQFPLLGIVTKNEEGQDCLVLEEGKHPIDIEDLVKHFNPAFVFFNSGRWIEELLQIRAIFPRAKFLYRTGGNEIVQASLISEQISVHSLRQSYWVKQINNSIDVLITNSLYTERRLLDLQVKCSFARFVGGVNTAALRTSNAVPNNVLTLFCAARFVPYKNHSLLLSVIHKLILRGHKLKLRLAGDGPLLESIKDQAIKQGLTQVVEFLGVLDNQTTCHEISCADIYIQFSIDQLTDVPGGTYIHSEGMGRSILEALTAGTFVIAGQSGALSEIVTKDKGILLDLNHLEEVVDKIEKIIEQPPGRLPFLEDYCWTKIFKRYEELLGKLNESIIGYREMRSY